MGKIQENDVAQDITPGKFRIRMTEAILQMAEAVVAGTTPMGRIGQPGELAPTVLFLASEGVCTIKCSTFVNYFTFRL